jgi:hypothetical protein
MSRLRNFLLTATMAMLLCGLAATPARGQFIGYTSPQTNTKTYTPLSCSGGGTAVFNVPNIGQTVHFASYFITGNPVTVNVYFQAVDPTSLAVYVVSDISTDPINGGILTANGSYAKIQIAVQCSGNGSVTVTYYGSSSNSVPTTGLQDQTSYRRILAYKQSGAAGSVFSVQTPYGNSCGQLQFTYETAQAGSTISVSTAPEGPLSPAGTNNTILAATALPNSTTTQFIEVPCQPTTKALVNFVGAGAGTYDLTYIFYKPGVSSSTSSGSNVNVAQWGGTATSLGQKAMAASVPVAIASDQSAIPVTIGGSGGLGVIQPSTTRNSETTSAVNTAITVSIAASGSTRVYLYGVAARCSAGNASITIKDGVAGTIIWSSDANFVGTSTTSIAWTSAPLASSAGNGMDIVLSACGGGNTGTLDVQASQL